MKKISLLLPLALLLCDNFIGASGCPTIESLVRLGEGYNGQVGIDLLGNGVFLAQRNLAFQETVIRAWYYTATTNSYTGPVIISNPYVNSTQLTFAYCKALSTAVAAWKEDDHIVARSKPATLNLDNWLDIVVTTTASDFNYDQPNVCMNSIGNAFLTWRRTDKLGNRTIEYSTQPSATDAWAAPIQIASDKTIEYPLIAANANGDLFIIWLQGGQLWGSRKPSAGPWDLPLVLSGGTNKPESYRPLVGINGGDIALYSQDTVGFTNFHITSWSTPIHVGTGNAFTVNLVQSAGTGVIFAVKGLGPINANTAEGTNPATWGQIKLNINDEGGDPFIDANDPGMSWSIWGSISPLSGTQVRFFNGSGLCDLVQIDNGLASAPKVAMDNLINADSSLPTRPQAHFLWLTPRVDYLDDEIALPA